MHATKIAGADARVTETPNASMTTLASPTQGRTELLSMWRVTMRAGQSGPQHTFDVEQAWHLQDGEATVLIDDRTVDLSSGDTLVIPADIQRQIRTASGAAFIVTGLSRGLAVPISADGPGAGVAPAWIV